MEFLKCKHCENVVAFVKNEGNKISCCNDIMEKMLVNNSDGSREKHMPIYEKNGNYLHVVVGEILHPSSKEHHIEWIALVTNKGNQRKVLLDNDKAETYFLIEEDDEVKELYAYCNLHGLWGIKKE